MDHFCIRFIASIYFVIYSTEVLKEHVWRCYLVSEPERERVMRLKVGLAPGVFGEIIRGWREWGRGVGRRIC
jgi:hypothetical protein